MSSCPSVRLHPRVVPALLALLSLWGLAGWWPMLADNAPAWTGIVPIPVALLAVLLLWIFVARSRRRAQKILLVLITAGLVAGFWRDAGGRQRAISPNTPDTLRVMQWTAAEDTPARSILATLAENDPPHILILTRPTLTQMERSERRALHLKNTLVEGQSFVLSRYPIRQLVAPQLDLTHTLLAEVTAPQGPIHVLALDAGTRPISLAAIAGLREWLRAQPADIPLIIAGGHNRSRTDAAWKPLREWVQPAYEVAGYGWPYSWPSPLPLFSRDSVWVSRNLNIQSAAYRASPQSQHAREIVALALPEAP